MNIKGKKIAIVGAAKSGLAAAKTLYEGGADIFISDITLHAATKLYDSNNDRYKVEIEARKGQVFGEDDDSLCV